MPKDRAILVGSSYGGFTALALYLDDADKPLGARFMHDATGFTFFTNYNSRKGRELGFVGAQLGDAGGGGVGKSHPIGLATVVSGATTGSIGTPAAL